ncbi:MAG: AMP-binding protein, partial [Paracoccaceae bacterium]|nr:AMP-binding protein [Paracoccaceae bacterium]
MEEPLRVLARLAGGLLGTSAEKLDPDTELVALGLDSLRVLKLAAAYRAEGFEAPFKVLMERPTLAAWARASSRTTIPGRKPAKPPPEAFPLRDMQRAYFAARQGLGAYASGAHHYFEFESDVDPGRLSRAVDAVIDRHAALRLMIRSNGTQRILPQSPVALKRIDLQRMSEVERQLRLDQLRKEGNSDPLAPERGETIAVTIVQLGRGRVRVLLKVDMIACDAAGFRVLLKDLAAAYKDPNCLPRQGDQDFARHAALEAQEVDTDLVKRWLDRLDDIALAPTLPHRPAPGTAQPMFRRMSCLDTGVVTKLKRVCAEHGLTPTSVLAAIYGRVLQSFSLQSRFVITVPVIGQMTRLESELTPVGNFTEAVPLIWSDSADARMSETARRIQNDLLRDLEDAHFTTTGLGRALADAGRASGARAVFTSMVGMGDLIPFEARELLGAPVWIASETPDVGLDLQVFEDAAGLQIVWEAREAFVDEACLHAMAKAFDAAVRDVADGHDRTPTEAQYFDRAAAVAGPTLPLPNARLEAALKEFAATQPDAAALVSMDGSTHLTYRQLYDAACCVAGGLAASGAEPGDVIALAIPDVQQEVIAVYGCLMVGAAYMPIRADAPDTMVSSMCDCADPRFCVTGENAAEVFAGLDGLSVNTLPMAELMRAAHPVPDHPIDAKATAYVLFTSGSTGRPKAVAVSHASASNTIAAICHELELDGRPCFLGLSDLTFDLSVFDIFAALRSGGKILRVGRQDRFYPVRWCVACRDADVQIWQSAPQFLELALKSRESPMLQGLRHILLGGDVVRPSLLSKLRETAHGARLYCLGGATEAAIHSTIFEITNAELPAPAPYGWPLANVTCRVVDNEGRDRPWGAKGELWIGGASLAEGYLGDDERTSERFVRSGSARWYRTGDVAYFDSDRMICFAGRLDQRIKISGQLADLAEIETALCDLPGIDGAVAMHADDIGLAFAVLAPDGSHAAVLSQIRATLPGYLHPARLVTKSGFPVTANGKTDRAKLIQALRRVDTGNRTGDDHAHRLQLVLNIAGEVLKRPVNDPDGRFFALGGNSLMVIDFVSRLEAHGLRLSAAHETVATRTFAGIAAAATSVEPAEVLNPGVALQTDVQSAYAFGRGDTFEYGGIAPLWYWEFQRSTLDPDKLEAALQHLIAQNPATHHVISSNGTPVPANPVPKALVTRHVLAPGRSVDDARDTMRDELMGALDGAGEPPHVRAGILRLASDDIRIGLAFDIMFLDANSISRSIRELGAMLADRPLPPVPTDRLSPARSPAACKAARANWASRLPSLPGRPSLPLRHDPTEKPRFARRRLVLNARDWQTIKTISSDNAVTPTVLVATVYAEVLRTWVQDEAVCLNVTLFDKNPEQAGAMGEFTRLVPVWAEALGGTLAAVGHALTREFARAVDGADYGSLDLIRDLTQARDAGQVLLPLVYTSTLGLAQGDLLGDCGLGTYVDGLSQTPQTWIDCQVMESGDALHINWDVLETAFPDGLIDAMFSGFCAIIEALVTMPESWQDTAQKCLTGTTLRSPGKAPRPQATLHLPVFEQADRQPDAKALTTAAGQDVTYGALRVGALRLAAKLRTSGVRPGDRVGIMLADRADQITAALAVLHLRAAYVPIGPAWPDARVSQVLKMAGIAVLVGDDCLKGTFVQVVSPHDAEDTRPDASDTTSEAKGSDTAYVIFTSGTTGAAKGVAVSHSAARNTLDAVQAYLDLDADSVCLAVSPFDFDLSVFDIFGVLGVGGHLVLTPADGLPAPATWGRLIAQHKVTVWNSAPPLFGMLLDATKNGTPLAILKHVLLSGDRIPPDVFARMRQLTPNATLMAMGGATEAGIWSNAYRAKDLPSGWLVVPYGTSLAGQCHQICDDDGNVLPEWAPGELWIGGYSLALGYENDPDRTKAEFPRQGGARWYRTGDLARIRGDGLIEFIGRSDPGMVKINGVRI